MKDESGVWMTSEVAIPQPVLDALTEGRLVFFVGAGASVGEPSNLPLFDGLARQLARLARVEYQPDQPIDSFLGSLPTDFDTHLHTKNLISNGKSSANATHAAITRLSYATGSLRIVTTNFDDHLAASAADQGISLPERWDGPALPIGDDFEGLVHLHGSVLDQPRRLVLTDRDFGRAYLTQAWATRFLIPMFQHFTVLFVGYSHDDPIMRYLGLGLPSGTTRYALVPTQNAQSSWWTRLGVTPIGYPVRDGDHSALVDCLDAWSARARMGQLDHRARMQELVAANTSLTPVDRDYLTERLRFTDGAKDFAHAVRSASYSDRVSWLRWVEDQETFQGLFQNAPTSGATSVLAQWFGDCFIAEPKLHVEALNTVQRLGQNFSEELFKSACWAAEALDSQDATAGLRWKTLLSTSVQHVPDLASLVPYAPGATTEGAPVLRTILRPRIHLRAHWFSDTENSSEPTTSLPRVELLWPTNSESVAAHLQRALEERVPGDRKLGVLLEDSLSSIYDLLEAFHGKPETGGLSFLRSAIEPHDQDQFPEPTDAIIDALRDYGERAIHTDPGLPATWWSLGHSLFKRLALHLLAEDPRTTPDDKMRWILQRSALYAPHLKHEVYRVLSVATAQASHLARAELLEAAGSGPDYPEEISDRERHVAYEKYNLFVWLAQVAPGWNEASTKLGELQEQNPNFAPREHPDFDHWMESGVWGSRLPMEVDEFVELFEQSPQATLDDLLSRDYSSIDFDRLEWSDCLDLFRRAAEMRPSLGLQLWEEVSLRVDLDTKKAEIQRAVVNGWAEADLGEAAAGMVSLVGTLLHDPGATATICSFLYRQIKLLVDSDESETTARMRQMARDVWAEHEASFNQVEAEDALSFAPLHLNSWPGHLAHFWIMEIDRRWRHQREEWAGFSDEESFALSELLSGPPATRDAVHPAFAGVLYFLFVADSSFAKEHFFPLFRGATALKCWFAYLHRPRVDDRLLSAGFLELLSDHWKDLDHLDRHAPIQANFLRLIATIVCFAGVPTAEKESLLAKSVLTKEGEFAPNFASATVDVLRADEIRGGEVWSSWLRNHVQNRLAGIPRKARYAELQRWADVVPYLGPSIPEGIAMFAGHELGLGEDFREPKIPDEALTQHAYALVSHYIERLDNSGPLWGLGAYRVKKLISSLRDYVDDDSIVRLRHAANRAGANDI